MNMPPFWHIYVLCNYVICQSPLSTFLRRRPENCNLRMNLAAWQAYLILLSNIIMLQYCQFQDMDCNSFYHRKSLIHVSVFISYNLKLYIIISGLFSLLPPACSHFQSLQYYKTSINPSGCEYVGVKCESRKQFKLGQCRRCESDGQNCAIMGAYACDCLKSTQLNEGNSNDVSYYVNTKPLCPYCGL